MADTKISNLTAIDAVAGGDKFGCADASDLTASKSATATQIAAFVSPAASDTVAGVIEIAVQAEQETGTDVVRAVTPGRQQFHPSAAKFWVKATGGSTTIVVSYNMTSWANTATGDADGTIATVFSSADWCGIVKTQTAANGWDAQEMQSCGFDAQAAGTFGVLCSTITDGNTAACSLTNPDQWYVVGFGDQ